MANSKYQSGCVG